MLNASNWRLWRYILKHIYMELGIKAVTHEKKLYETQSLYCVIFKGICQYKSICSRPFTLNLNFNI